MSAVPFAFITVPPPEQGSLPSSLINVDHLLPPLIFDDRGEFSSAAFRIKYCDEEVRTQHQSAGHACFRRRRGDECAEHCILPLTTRRHLRPRSDPYAHDRPLSGRAAAREGA
eukprot:22273-Prymnesium_polylepis.1